MWLLDKMARRYTTRPSELLDLDDSYVAYCLDEAVLTFCAGVEGKLEEVKTPKGRRGPERRAKNQQALLNKLLKMPEDNKPKFRDPADLLRR